MFQPPHPVTQVRNITTAMLARNVPGTVEIISDSGPVPRAEFKNIITDLLKIPSGLDLPQERVMSMWRNADKAGGWNGKEVSGGSTHLGGEDGLIH